MTKFTAKTNNTFCVLVGTYTSTVIINVLRTRIAMPEKSAGIWLRKMQMFAPLILSLHYFLCS